VRAVREGDRDEMIVSVASEAPAAEFPAIRAELEQSLKEELGLRIRAEVVSPGALDARTEIHTSPKPKRFRDERKR
jgi:phenylacetate-coenzyme A ligase PaaK-like adenylate-forming protein